MVMVFIFIFYAAGCDCKGVYMWFLVSCGWFFALAIFILQVPKSNAQLRFVDYIYVYYVEYMYMYIFYFFDD